MHEHHEHHGHHHHHTPAKFDRAFSIGVLLNLSYVVLLVVFGLFAHSLALLGEATHNFSDALGLILAWWTNRLVNRAPTAHRTFGLRSGTILSALINAAVLVLVTGGIGWESIQRLLNPTNVAGETMSLVAFGGIILNSLTALLFFKGRKEDLNVRSAFAHMASDAGLSLGIVVAGIVIALTGWNLVDPIISLVISGIILWGTWDILRDSFNLALAAVPEHIDAAAIEQYLRGIPGVSNVHDLHIWPIDTANCAMMAHIIIVDLTVETDTILHTTRATLRSKYGIAHPTIQVERDERCPEFGFQFGQIDAAGEEEVLFHHQDGDEHDHHEHEEDQHHHEHDEAEKEHIH